MGPETLGEFIMQRRRNYAGHLHLVHKYGYRVSSLETSRVLRIGLEEMFKAFRLISTLIALAMIEALARVLGAYDYYVQGKKHVVWDVAWTTKQLNGKETPAPSFQVPTTSDNEKKPTVM
jgi:cellulose synthase/poly-beta-1,6-N-acetylglucosamine synthase-like glycosyltransferase